MDSSDFKNKIKSNIEGKGLHISIVSGGQEPRYAYTIGNQEKINTEFIFAGGIYYLLDDVIKILNDISNNIRSSKNEEIDSKIFSIKNLGYFTLRKVDKSWAQITMLGVFDYYNLDDIDAYQVLPEKQFQTIDIPNMSLTYGTFKDSVWKWLKDDWKYNISNKITVVTNLNALQGQPITEVMRWEEDEWEMFSGNSSEVEEKDVRIVPIGVLFGIDNSLTTALDLDVGKGMWRERANSKWNDWTTTS